MIGALELTLFKRFACRGHRRSFVSATCGDGKLEALASAFRLLPANSEVPQEDPAVRACATKR